MYFFSFPPAFFRKLLQFTLISIEGILLFSSHFNKFQPILKISKVCVSWISQLLVFNSKPPRNLKKVPEKGPQKMPISRSKSGHFRQKLRRNLPTLSPEIWYECYFNSNKLIFWEALCGIKLCTFGEPYTNLQRDYCTSMLCLFVYVFHVIIDGKK